MPVAGRARYCAEAGTAWMVSDISVVSQHRLILSAMEPLAKPGV